LARRPASEIRVHDQHAGLAIPRIIERVLRGLPVVLEDVLLEPVEGNGAQEARRHDAVSVDVWAAKRHPAARRECDLLHQFTSSRTSVTSPATAAAATIAGLMSSVRPVGL